MRRVLAIGLDAASLELLDRWAGEGHLPHLAGLLAEGRRARVTHPSDYRAELPWTSFWTGRDGRANRYWGTLRFDPSAYEVAEAGALRAAPFYASWGRPVVVLDVPHCPPWPGVPGAQVAAWGAHSPQVPHSSEPAGTARELVQRIGGHPAFEADSQPGWHSPLYLDPLIEALAQGAARRAEAARWLAARVPEWSLLLTVFSEPHSAGHHLWHGIDPTHPLAGEALAVEARRRLARVHAAVDAAVGRLLALADGETVVVLFSVHGTVANANDLPALHLVPELIHRLHGNPPLLRGAWGDVARPPRVPPERAALGDVLTPLHRWPLGRRARDGLRRLQRSFDPRAAAWYRVEPIVPVERSTDVAYDARSPDYLGTGRYRSRWATQRVFALPTFSDTHLRVNLVGREAAGLVAADAYPTELDRWEAELRACVDPRRGRAPDLQVSRPRAGDPFDPDAPPADMVVRLGDVVDSLEHPVAGRIGPLPFLRTGEHGGDGFVVVRGLPSGVVVPARLPVTALAALLGQFACA